MNHFSWWHVAVGATVLALAAAVASNFSASPGATIGAWTCLAVLGGGYVLFGWRSFTAADPADDEFAAAASASRTSAAGLVFPLLAIVCTSVGVAFDPNLATLQVIAFPIIWFSVDPMSRAIVLNVLLAVGVTIGILVSTGTDPASVVQAVVIETISLLFSLALGLWFSFALAQGHENTRLLAELRAAQGELAALNRETGIVSERERLSGEIHDTIAQSLTGLVMLAQRTRSQLPDDQTAARENLALIEDIARDALVETRALVVASAPVDSTGGLVAALERLIARFTRETAVTISLDAAGYASQPNEIEVVLLRCAQEALANVRKHSGASSVSIVLAAAGSEITLSVSDNGSGLDASRPIDGGFGLSGMQQRLALVSGTMRVAQPASGGVELIVTLPADATPAASAAALTSLGADGLLS